MLFVNLVDLDFPEPVLQPNLDKRVHSCLCVKEMHIFAIGDWGGMDGSLDTNEGRPNIVAYDWGKRPGPSVFPRSRWDKAHTVQLCAPEKIDKYFWIQIFLELKGSCLLFTKLAARVKPVEIEFSIQFGGEARRSQTTGAVFQHAWTTTLHSRVRLCSRCILPGNLWPYDLQQNPESSVDSHGFFYFFFSLTYEFLAENHEVEQTFQRFRRGW